MKLEWARKEIFTKVKLDDHLEEHAKASLLLGWDIDGPNVNPLQHLEAHMEYRYRADLLTEDQRVRYLDYLRKSNG